MKAYYDFKESQSFFMQEMLKETERLNPQLPSLYKDGFVDAMAYADLCLEKIFEAEKCGLFFKGCDDE